MRRIPRLWRPRSLGLFLLVLALAGFSGVFSAYHCCGVGQFCPDPGDPPPSNLNLGGPPPPTATPDPLSPWDTYDFQGWSPQHFGTYVTTDGQVYVAWFHGYVADTGTVDNEADYNFSITGTVTEMVITHGDASIVPVDWLPIQWEYIYDGVNHTPVISIETLDGCEDPYPTPVECDTGSPAIPNDPYGSNGDDYTISNYATYPAYATIWTHATLETTAAVDCCVAATGTKMDWNHRVVYP
jgi:hypothetical protein